MSTKPGETHSQDEVPTPTTEEALPNVDLSTDEETERISRETLGPEAGEKAKE